MSNPRHRTERLAHLIQKEVAEMIVRELKDPRIGFATITRVDLSADLHHAHVLVSVLGTEEARQDTLQGLTSAGGYIRHEIGHRLKLRRAPELTFALDHGAEESEKIAVLLQRLKQSE
jgi:ribosome-binding factor A